MASDLILIPTEKEKEILLRECPALSSHDVRVCGFGAISSLAIASRWFQDRKDSRCFLLGIAGRYDESLQLGRAYRISRVALYGIGAGTGREFSLPHQMGFANTGNHETPIGQTIPLGDNGNAEAIEMLTVASAAGSTEEVNHRLESFPSARCEDMEGFSVALAAQLANVTLTIIRGISNQAGDRNIANWKIEESLADVGTHCLQLIESTAKS